MGRPSPAGQAPAGGWALGVDTSAAGGEVALADPAGEVAAKAALPLEPRSSVTLLAALQRLLAGAGVDLGRIAALGVAIGPGSFTGLRVSLATCKGLALGLGRPLYGVSSLEALARAAAELWGAGGGEPAEWILPFRDAHYGELFCALFGPWGPGGGEASGCFRFREDAAVSPAELRLPEEGTLLLSGPEADLAPPLRSALASPRVHHVEVQTAAGPVARLAWEALREGRPPAGPGLEPFYGRRPRAQTRWPPPRVDPEGGFP